MQTSRERRERVRLHGRRRLQCGELNGALELGEERVAGAALEHIPAQPVMKYGSAEPIALADELDRPPRELYCARRVARPARELRGPCADLVEIEPDQLGSSRHRVPQGERAVDMRAT